MDYKQKKTQHSASAIKDLSTDSFSKEKTNNISFKSAEGSVVGGVFGACLGVVAAVALTVATGGIAAPLIPYAASLAAGGAAGAIIGDSIEGDD